MENEKINRLVTRKRRSLRITKKLRSSPQRYRLAVRRSNRHFYVQLIDDELQKVVVGCGTTSKDFQTKVSRCKSKEAARLIGTMIAEEAKNHDVTTVVFDRGRWKYHGLIALLADAASESGLKF